MKYFVVSILFVLCLPLAAQISSYTELEFRPDSTTVSYTPTKKNFVFLRSKRGTDGMNKTDRADSIVAASLPVSQIVLVFTEINPDALAEREEANGERWDNLIMTYPEFFQAKTIYKTVCQCNASGDADAFKQSQGFYVYFKGEEPKVVNTPPPASQPAKTEPAPAAKVDPSATKAAKPETKTPPAKEAAPVDNTAVNAKEAPPVVEKQAEAPPVSPPSPAPVTRQEEAIDEETAPVKESPRAAKKGAVVKPRRSKDKKACRPPCYEGGDEDLNAFFRQSITLTKKQKRKGKNLVAVVKLQLHFDGTIKKETVTGDNDSFNQQVETAVKSMNAWNAAVKNGVAVKSDVKITLKFDKESKSIKPFEVIANPHQGPKCKCASDAEIFGN